MSTTVAESRPSSMIAASVVIGACVIVVAGVAGLATDVSSSWYVGLIKPPWQPPDYLFGPVWTTIYVLLACSGIAAYRRVPTEDRRSIMILFAVNGLLNMCWSFLFFRLHSPLIAGIEIVILWTTIVALVARLYNHSRIGALLLVPYLLWVSFASVLNWTIASANSALSASP